jgi:hypothetical protein
LDDLGLAEDFIERLRVTFIILGTLKSFGETVFISALAIAAMN